MPFWKAERIQTSGRVCPRRCNSASRGGDKPRRSSIYVRVRPEILQDFLPLLLVEHQIDALAVVAPLDAPLGLGKEWQVAIPIDIAAAEGAPVQAVHDGVVAFADTTAYGVVP